jgi:hypothetical protein
VAPVGRPDDGQDWITNEGGTSLFDRDAVFPRKTWTTFRIPKGTVVPDSICLKTMAGASDSRPLST